MTIAAPGPVFGVVDEAAGDGVSVDVPELLGELLLGKNVEIVIVELPETRAVAFQLFGSLSFEGAKDAAQWQRRWFAQQQVNVFRHKNVTEDVELVALSEAFKGFDEHGAVVVIVEVGKAFVTAEGDEVVVAEGVISLQMARHVGMIPDGVPRSWTAFCP